MSIRSACCREVLQIITGVGTTDGHLGLLLLCF